MSRLINADDIKFETLIVEKDTPSVKYRKRTAVAFKRDIDAIPTVDAEPVRHGKWIIRDNPGTGWYRVTCSECGEDVTSTAPCIGFFPNVKVSWNYCPNCGAKMDKVDE